MEQQKQVQDTFARARSGLLIMLLLTVANLATVVLMKSETVFVFAAAIPEIALSVLMGAYYSPEQPLYLMILAGAVLAAVLVLYFLCWLFCKKKPRWMTLSLILFAVDCAALIVWLLVALYEVNTTGGDIDLIVTTLRLLFSGWVLYYLVRGVKAAKHLKVPNKAATETDLPTA